MFNRIMRTLAPAAIFLSLTVVPALVEGASDIGDRAEAIEAGIAALQKGDTLLIAGKGHETGQIVGDKVLPFSDHEAVAAALATRVA